ncbi:zinc-binding alcohol dehydrogenase [Rhodococcus sp. KRD162]|uniref:zinc-dependent alcohol dehydrogenase n=1 Tax=Rhodococcus sp. KRD162 TaxID=2729725 RepID=UPI0019CF98B7|nr:zinc-binding alcohol dehydrogenase [Rhodococcus sp. KRD162]
MGEHDIREGQVRFEAVATAVSGGTELMLVDGRAPRSSFSWDAARRLLAPRADNGGLYPVSLGYQFVGRVTEVGPGADDRFTVGEHCWIDAAHQDSLVIDLSDPPPIRKVNVDPIWHAAYLPLVRIALGAVHDARPLLGDHAAVFGGGMIGLLSALLLERAGAASVTLIEPGAARRLVAETLGFQTVDPNISSASVLLEDSGRRPDVVIEATGSYAALNQAVRTVRSHGSVVCVSSYGNQDSELVLGHEFHRNRITLLSSMTVNGCVHREAPRWDLERLILESLRLIETGAFPFGAMGVEVVHFDEALTAYDRLRNPASAPVSVRFVFRGGRG